jgi:uncharacterized membrane protein
VKARTLILTAGATLALAVPAANAAIAKNALYHQAQVHTVLAEKNNQAASKTQAYVLRDNGMWVRVTAAKNTTSVSSSYVQGSAGRGSQYVPHQTGISGVPVASGQTLSHMMKTFH